MEKKIFLKILKRSLVELKALGNLSKKWKTVKTQEKTEEIDRVGVTVASYLSTKEALSCICVNKSSFFRVVQNRTLLST